MLGLQRFLTLAFLFFGAIATVHGSVVNINPPKSIHCVAEARNEIEVAHLAKRGTGAQTAAQKEEERRKREKGEQERRKKEEEERKKKAQEARRRRNEDERGWLNRGKYRNC